MSCSPFRSWPLAFLLVAGAVCADNLSYTRALFEREPNDAPEQAQPFRGAAQVVGELPGGDVDHFWWVVEEAEAGQLWRITLNGETSAQIRLAMSWPPEEDSGPPAVMEFGAEPQPAARAGRELLAIEIDRRDPSASSHELLVPPGDHLITVTGSGAYELIFERTRSASVHRRIQAADDSPYRLNPRQNGYTIERPEAVLELPAGDPVDGLWGLSLTGELDRELEAIVVNGDGSELARQRATGLHQDWNTLALDAGAELRLRALDAEQIGRLRFDWSAQGRRGGSTRTRAGSEAETRWFEPGQSVLIEGLDSQREHLAFAIDEDQASTRWHIDIESDQDSDTQVCLHRLGARASACRSAPSGRVFNNMQLEPGQYELRLQRDRNQPAARVSLTLLGGTPPASNEARRPNDNSDWAAPLPPGESREGDFDEHQRAWFELRVPEPARFWSIEADAEQLTRMTVYPGTSTNALIQAEASSGQALTRINQLWLEPGWYRIQLQGQGDPYRLLATPQDPPDGPWEIEPNDNERQANRIDIGQTLQGAIQTRNDRDHYYFELPGWNHLELNVLPVEGQTLRAELSWGGQRILLAQVSADRPLHFGQMLPPGDYAFSLSGDAAPGQPYHIETALRSPLTRPGPDQSGPTRALAMQLPRDGQLELRHGGFGTHQAYIALPVSDQARTVRLRFDGGRLPMELSDQTGAALLIEDEEDTLRRFDLAAGQRAWLSIRPGSHARSLQFDDPALARTAADALELALTEAGPHELAAYRPEAQRLPARLVATNRGESTLSIPLEWRASHAGVETRGLPDRLTLASGASQQIEFDWLLPPGLPSAMPMQLYLVAGTTEAGQQLAINAGVSPLHPQPHTALPADLLGLTDLAWSALGARFVDAQGETVEEQYNQQRVRLQHLIDGMSSGGNTMSWRGSAPLPALALAGEGGRIHALVFNQRSSLGRNHRWQRVRIEHAINPGQWQPLTELSLDANDGEQYFRLEQPVETRYLRLTPLESWGGLDDRSLNGSGQFRALGEPLGTLAEQGHDLLATELGGHWVYSRPADATPQNFPYDQQRLNNGVTGRHDQAELVYAFLQHRAGYIESLAWEEDPGRNGEPIERIRVYTATDSPLGPWQDHGDWPLERNAQGQARFEFNGPTAARYLRLVLELPASSQARGNYRTWRPPTAIRAFEAHGLGSRRSLLGHWGQDDAFGPVEHERAATTRANLAIDDRDSHPDRPRPLADRIRGELERPGDRRSYRLRLDAPDNSFRLRLQEAQIGRLTPSLLDPSGAPIALEWTRQDDGWRQAEAVGLDPGDYRLDIAEPPRSIVFLWDGSGSVAALQPAIYQALNRFAEGLIPGQEAFNLMPLGGPLLIDGWAEQPREIGRALAAYDNRFSSSDSEPSLIAAAAALQRREGERIIFLLTDAEVIGRDLEVWSSLERVRPRVMALEISHGTPRDTAATRSYQNLMKSWTRAGGGEYYYTVDRSALIQSFEAAMDRIRQPSQFELNVERGYIEPPAPGQLRVTSGARPVVSGGAIHLIFDASGSMLRRMEGGRRIDVARQIVREVLEQNIPPEVPVALRAFGHTEPHSCETELLVQPGTDNRAEVLSAVAGIQAINLARTPLAASLDAVPNDLRRHAEQRQLVVMFTDGEETCDGDVEAAVRALVARGIDVRLNIVGFHIDTIELQNEFERYAALAGGEYFDTRDSQGLSASLVEALAAPFRVYDRDGEAVARGRVDGESLTLEPGAYRVVIEASGGDLEYEFELAPSTIHELSVNQP